MNLVLIHLKGIYVSILVKLHSDPICHSWEISTQSPVICFNVKIKTENQRNEVLLFNVRKCHFCLLQVAVL